MAKHPKHKKGAWFIKVRGSYLPCNLPGALTYIPMVAFLVAATMYVASNTETITGIIFGIFPYFVCTAVVMHWIAANKS